MNAVTSRANQQFEVHILYLLFRCQVNEFWQQYFKNLTLF